jgi:hypothetical protein
MKLAKPALLAVMLASLAVCTVASAQTKAVARPSNQHQNQSQNVTAAHKALADPAFKALLDKADADGARRVLVKYGAQSNAQIAVQRPAQFNVSGGMHGLEGRLLPMSCKTWVYLYTVYVGAPPGTPVEVMGCAGYEINHGAGAPG